MEKQKITLALPDVEEIRQKKNRIAVIQGEGRGGGGQDMQCQQSKKDRSARHSYHQGGHQSNYINGHIFESNSNPQFTDQHHVMLSRERSFVRPHSAFHNMHAQSGQQIEEMHRQRSFHQGQIQQGRDQQHHFSCRGRKTSGGMSPNTRGKPAMEIYRPPTLRGPNGYETDGELCNFKGINGVYASYADNHHHRNKRQGLNIHAKEFISVDQREGKLHHSKSSSNVFAKLEKKGGLHHSKSGHMISATLEGEIKHKNQSPPRVHFSDDKENVNDAKPGLVPRPSNTVIGPSGPTNSPIKRSKSLGAADLRIPSSNPNSLADNIGPFSQDVQTSISKAINDPNALSARLLMEVVRHVFTRVIESSRYSEPTARICINIIEKEKDETFLETLLNTCQEYFQQRDRLLRVSSPAVHPGYVNSHPKWIAYMSFLNEMYTQLKRRHAQLMTRRMKNSDTAPGLLLLSLLAQCCQICLKEQAVNSLAETECLFFVLTAVGRDIEIELPQQMARVMCAARDAFMTTVRVPAVKKTLLQLIEMHAARWQLPAPAVLYYYPGSGAK